MKLQEIKQVKWFGHTSRADNRKNPITKAGGPGDQEEGTGWWILRDGTGAREKFTGHVRYVYGQECGRRLPTTWHWKAEGPERKRDFQYLQVSLSISWDIWRSLQNSYNEAILDLEIKINNWIVQYLKFRLNIVF